METSHWAVKAVELCIVVIGGFIVIRSAILKWNRIDLLSIDTPISLVVIVYHFVMILTVIYLLSVVLFR